MIVSEVARNLKENCSVMVFTGYRRERGNPFISGEIAGFFETGTRSPCGSFRME